MTQKATKSVEIETIQIRQGVLKCYVLGTTPLILNRPSQKVREGLLLPPKRKNRNEKETTLKHDPLEEYRASPYTLADGPSLLAMPVTAFKSAMRSAAIDMPGASKAEIGRLTYLEGEYAPIYGVPLMSMMMVRSADMNRTPDIRTRAIVPAWATRLCVRFTMPMLTDRVVANLLAAAGLIRGVGDFRPEKGAGNFGQFELVDAGDKRLKQIMASGGRAAQTAAMETPAHYDQETADLFSYWSAEATRRGLRAA